MPAGRLQAAARKPYDRVDGTRNDRDVEGAMSEQPLRGPDRFFFGTRILPCPYLPGRRERKVVTDLTGTGAAELYERMSRAGFRRSHGLAYRPACPDCSACIPIRIRTAGFEMTRSIRRVVRANADLAVEDMSAIATVEQYRLFARYQRSRHGGGDMSSMTFHDYRSMVEDTPVDTRSIEFRTADGALAGVMLADRLGDSLSAVYSFFGPDESRRSLGTYMVYWLVKKATETGLPHVYLGYWIEECAKMSYKVRFRPVEILGPGGWREHRPNGAE